MSRSRITSLRVFPDGVGTSGKLTDSSGASLDNEYDSPDNKLGKFIEFIVPEKPEKVIRSLGPYFDDLKDTSKTIQIIPRMVSVQKDLVSAQPGSDQNEASDSEANLPGGEKRREIAWDCANSPDQCPESPQIDHPSEQLQKAPRRPLRAVEIRDTGNRDATSPPENAALHHNR
jgi:hypothetical protein